MRCPESCREVVDMDVGSAAGVDFDDLCIRGDDAVGDDGTVSRIAVDDGCVGDMATVPLLRVREGSRLGASGTGELISFALTVAGCRLVRRDRSFPGDTKAVRGVDEDAAMAGWELGEGNAWEDRCKAGEDIEA